MTFEQNLQTILGQKDFVIAQLTTKVQAAEEEIAALKAKLEKQGTA